MHYILEGSGGKIFRAGSYRHIADPVDMEEAVPPQNLIYFLFQLLFSVISFKQFCTLRSPSVECVSTEGVQYAIQLVGSWHNICQPRALTAWPPCKIFDFAKRFSVDLPSTVYGC